MQAQTAADEDAFVDWIRPSLLAMTRLAARLVPAHDVDDVVQDAAERAWRARERYDPARSSPTTWLLTITVTAARDAHRGTFRRRRVAEALTASEAVTDSGVDVDLERAVVTLPRRQRLAVHLFYFLDVPVAEAAQVMGCSVGTVKSTLHDARQALRRVLDEENGSDDA
ncbi:RNA polymerase sigma factor [Jatrophihabitans sp. YIM 134969]